MWPERNEVRQIEKFLDGRRPPYEVDYIRRYYNRENLSEPPCVLGYLQVFVMSNGDVLTGCYPLPPVGNILREKLAHGTCSPRRMPGRPRPWCGANVPVAPAASSRRWP